MEDSVPKRKQVASSVSTRTSPPATILGQTSSGTRYPLQTNLHVSRTDFQQLYTLSFFRRETSGWNKTKPKPKTLSLPAQCLRTLASIRTNILYAGRGLDHGNIRAQVTEVHKCIGKVLQCPIRTAPGFFYSVNDSYPRLFAYVEFHCLTIQKTLFA